MGNGMESNTEGNGYQRFGLRHDVDAGLKVGDTVQMVGRVIESSPYSRMAMVMPIEGDSESHRHSIAKQFLAKVPEDSIIHAEIRHNRKAIKRALRHIQATRSVLLSLAANQPDDTVRSMIEYELDRLVDNVVFPLKEMIGK